MIIKSIIISSKFNLISTTIYEMKRAWCLMPTCTYVCMSICILNTHNVFNIFRIYIHIHRTARYLIGMFSELSQPQGTTGLKVSETKRYLWNNSASKSVGIKSKLGLECPQITHFIFISNSIFDPLSLRFSKILATSLATLDSQFENS